MAEELIQLYAIREARQGNAFAPPDTLYREFEAAFEYEETPDQQRAIDETLAGMQSRKPTDRLICGDVGYGKTEVAMRAAFLAVEEGGKQVACWRRRFWRNSISRLFGIGFVTQYALKWSAVF